MVIDSSALVVIATQEPDAEYLIGFIQQADSCSISAASFLETGMVLKRDKTGRIFLPPFLKAQLAPVPERLP